MDNPTIRLRASGQVETVLAELAGPTPTERVLVVLKTASGSASRLDRSRSTAAQGQSGATIELRQQSWGPGIGWFTQSTVCLTPGQLAQLRLVLGRHPCNRSHLPAGAVTGQATPDAPQPMQGDKPTATRPLRVLRAEPA